APDIIRAIVAGSSNGRTADSGSVSLGSNPSPAAQRGEHRQMRDAPLHPWRVRLAAKDTALSRRRSRVRIPHALPRGSPVDGEPFFLRTPRRLQFRDVQVQHLGPIFV